MCIEIIVFDTERNSGKIGSLYLVFILGFYTLTNLSSHRKSPYSSGVEHSLRKRKVGGSIPPGG